MKLVPKNWFLTSYVTDEWTPVVSESELVIVATLVLCNTSSDTVTVGVRLGDSVDKLATIIPNKSILAGESFALDLRSVNVMVGQTLDIIVDQSGAEFLVSGVIEEPPQVGT